MEIAYRVETDACTFLLDEGGTCRSVVAASARSRAQEGRAVRIPPSAERCIGAQYVACIDMREAGGMVATPRAGAQMLFARADREGRISLVRSGTITRFEPVTGPVHGSGVRERPEPPRHQYADDEEATIPFACATVPFKRELLAPIMRASSIPPAPMRASSIPPAVPNRTSGIAPAAPASMRATIPPPPPAPRATRTPPTPYSPYVPPPPSSSPTIPRKPTLLRATAPSYEDWENETKPRKRAAR